MQCDNKDAVEIIPRLWLGNYKSASNILFLNEYKIKHIINLTKDVPNIFVNDPEVKINYLHIPMQDKDTCDKKVQYIFDKTSEYIYNALIKKESVLVHSVDGCDRSATIIAGFLIMYIKMDFDDTLKYINKIRKCALSKRTCFLTGLFDFYSTIQNNKKQDRKNSMLQNTIPVDIELLLENNKPKKYKY